jgi:hypothetical protein
MTSWTVDSVSDPPDRGEVRAAEGASIIATLDLTPSGYWHSEDELTHDAAGWLAAQHPGLRQIEAIPERWSVAARRVLLDGEILRRQRDRATVGEVMSHVGAVAADIDSGAIGSTHALAREVSMGRLLPRATLHALGPIAAAPDGASLADGLDERRLLLEIVARGERRRRRLARLRFRSEFLRGLASGLLAPVDESTAVVAAACEFALGPLGRSPVPIRSSELLLWATFGDAVVSALANARSRRRTLDIVESGQLDVHAAAVSAELGVPARLPVLVLDDDGWLDVLLGSGVQAVTIPDLGILLGAGAAESTVHARRRKKLGRVLVHELIHAGQGLDPNRLPLPVLRLADELLVEGATEIVTNRIMNAAHRNARNHGRSPYTADELVDVAYHPYVALCGAVLQTSFLTQVPTSAAVQLCTARDPLRLVRDWIGGTEPADRADVVAALRDLASEALRSFGSHQELRLLRLEALIRLGAIRRRRGLTTHEAFNLDYFVAKAKEIAGPASVHYSGPPQ